MKVRYSQGPILIVALLILYTEAAPLSIRQVVVDKLLGPELVNIKTKINNLSLVVDDLQRIVSVVAEQTEKIKKISAFRL